MVILAENKPLTERQKAALRLLVLQEREKAKRGERNVWKSTISSFVSHLEIENRAQEKEKTSKKKEEHVEKDETAKKDEKEAPASKRSKVEVRRAKIEQIKEEVEHKLILDYYTYSIQIGTLKERLEGLQGQKHQLFLQLKKA